MGRIPIVDAMGDVIGWIVEPSEEMGCLYILGGMFTLVVAVVWTISRSISKWGVETWFCVGAGLSCMIALISSSVLVVGVLTQNTKYTKAGAIFAILSIPIATFLLSWIATYVLSWLALVL